MRQWRTDELDRLYRYAASLTGAGEEALDLVQSALLRWLETGAGAAAVRSPLAYVMRVIRNLYLTAAVTRRCAIRLRLRTPNRSTWISLRSSSC
jgi:DNA-directed RNA polymerase specialized sigma24 family protein